MDYQNLLDEYRKLWKNRSLSADESAEFILKEAIVRELKDENAHPRVRKTLMEKYYMATKRIIESELSERSKLALIELHVVLMEFTK
ncbi:hypothetical protein RRV45_13185 [Bacillus sp. DTU_2020_1000418_1_SI_GHA_SEK_038]|uniref:hypothetical protein n=1 Tax=Bacillus sp. DTU_2020_1000418_1_SI_GHA_SEK_038 TaxID=3077585 RepID=UPI0028EC95A0|nr:hypothetical protein [Bacillus sp. DTU_2020_1000418_1_SI_GHA_SEK_038]WNS73872.1 hypothetical protein RRV45_13185 [Bacillus sp. DTU_2020_1000418_1_SI_GHA_SEK_038]